MNKKTFNKLSAQCRKGRNILRFSQQNEGVSLVEVLVSMLILAIIVVPFLSQFVVSARTNVKSRQHQNAITVAQNVMEGIKEFGLHKAALQFYGAEGSKLQFINSDSMDEESTYHELAKDSGVEKKNEEPSVLDGKFTRNSNNKYYYGIFGMNEGSSKYDVRLSFDASPYLEKEGANLYQFPDISTLAAETTALVNPSVIVSSSSYDDMALEYYYLLHQEYARLLFEVKQKEIYNKNQALIQEYEYKRAQWEVDGSIESPPNYPVLEETLGSPIIETREKIRSGMERKIELTISDYFEQDAGGVQVKKIRLDSRIIYNFDKNKNFINPELSLERIHTGYCDGAVYRELKDIYLFYSMFSTMGGKSFPPAQNQIIVRDERKDPAKKDVNLFVAVQTVKLSELSPEIMEDPQSYSHPEDLESKVHIESPVNVKLYCQYQLMVTGGGNQIEKKLYTNLEPTDRIYDVKIEVFKTGTEFRELEAVLNSTIMH